MTRIIMHGCNGRMGRVIAGLAAEDPDVALVAGVDVVGDGDGSFPVYRDISEVREEADVVVDFSRADTVDALLTHCEEKGLALVLCTTGLSDETLAHVERAAARIPLLRSANMSVGVNVLMKLLREAAPTLKEAGFDIEIVEKHHNQKLDAPSGTAIALADCMNDALTTRQDYVYDRSTRRQKRPSDEIGISAVRGGNIVGDHDVIFAGLDEVVTISHRAYSRSIFAKGAIQAAKFLCGRPVGSYSMADVIA